jgi:hypothetical protein
MSTKSRLRRITGLLAAGAGVAVGAYGAYAAVAWWRYGRIPRADGRERDHLLDQFMSAYEVVERHHIRVAAPAAVTMAAAREQDLFQAPVVRALFRARAIALGGVPDEGQQPRGLLAAVQALGWGVLADVPDRELVVGAVTKPWEANVTFQSLRPDDFAAFSQPGFVKIAWTLRADPVDSDTSMRADPVDSDTSIFRTETRAIATDGSARARFRRYWAFASPGIRLIRRLSLRPLKRDAERRAQAAHARMMTDAATIVARRTD